MDILDELSSIWLFSAAADSSSCDKSSLFNIILCISDGMINTVYSSVSAVLVQMYMKHFSRNRMRFNLHKKTRSKNYVGPFTYTLMHVISMPLKTVIMRMTVKIW